MNCPFCKISEKRIIQEKDKVLVILSDPRLMSGHLLIIPKRHIEKLSELTTDERSELFGAAIEFQEKVVKKFATGCDLNQNYRPFIKQNKLKINHIHIHLQPREFEDELYQKVQKFQKEVFKNLPQGELKKFKKLFSE